MFQCPYLPIKVFIAVNLGAMWAISCMSNEYMEMHLKCLQMASHGVFKGTTIDHHNTHSQQYIYSAALRKNKWYQNGHRLMVYKTVSFGTLFWSPFAKGHRFCLYFTKNGTKIVPQRALFYGPSNSFKGYCFGSVLFLSEGQEWWINNGSDSALVYLLGVKDSHPPHPPAQ